MIIINVFDIWNRSASWFNNVICTWSNQSNATINGWHLIELAAATLYNNNIQPRSIYSTKKNRHCQYQYSFVQLNWRQRVDRQRSINTLATRTAITASINDNSIQIGSSRINEITNGSFNEFGRPSHHIFYGFQLLLSLRPTLSPRSKHKCTFFFIFFFFLFVNPNIFVLQVLFADGG